MADPVVVGVEAAETDARANGAVVGHLGGWSGALNEFLCLMLGLKMLMVRGIER